MITVENLSTHFTTRRGIVRALDKVSFTVRPGETVALAGEPGSGKSVTSLSILRLLPRTGRIVGGQIRFRDAHGAVIELRGAPVQVMRRVRGGGIGMLFPEPMSALNPSQTVGAQIMQTIRLHQRMAPGAARRQAGSLLERVGISDPGRRLESYPHQLSAGMRQRVMIAIAVACRPRLLIADEPTTSLDAATQAQVLALLRDLQDETGMGMLFITHNLALIPHVADRMMVMYAGQIVEQGPASTVLARPRHPYSRALLDPLRHGPSRPMSRPGTTGAFALAEPGGPGPDLRYRSEACAYAPRCALTIAACREQTPALVSAGGGGRQSRCLRWRTM